MVAGPSRNGATAPVMPPHMAATQPPFHLPAAIVPMIAVLDAGQREDVSRVVGLEWPENQGPGVLAVELHEGSGSPGLRCKLCHKWIQDSGHLLSIGHVRRLANTHYALLSPDELAWRGLTSLTSRAAVVEEDVREAAAAAEERERQRVARDANARLAGK